MTKHITDRERDRKLLPLVPRVRALGAALARYMGLEHLMDESANQAVFFLWEKAEVYSRLEGTAFEGTAMQAVKWYMLGWLKQQRRRTHTSLQERIKVPGDEAFTGDELLERTPGEDTMVHRAEARLSFDWLWKHSKQVASEGACKRGRPRKAMLNEARMYLLLTLDIYPALEISAMTGLCRARVYGMARDGAAQVRQLANLCQ